MTIDFVSPFSKIEHGYSRRCNNSHVIGDAYLLSDRFYQLKVRHIYPVLFGPLGYAHWNENFGMIWVREKRKLASLLRNDYNDRTFNDFIRDVMSSKRILLMDLASWKRGVQARKTGKTDEENVVSIISLPNLSRSSKMILLRVEINSSNFPAVHSKRCAIEICYLAELSDYPQSKATEGAINVKNIIDDMDRKAVAYFENEPFLYVAKSKRRRDILEAARNAKRLEKVGQEFEDGSGYRNIYFGGLSCRPPEHMKMLEELGFERTEVDLATAIEILYRSVMKTALKQADTPAPVRIVVRGSRLAELLAEALGVQEIKKIGDLDLCGRSG